MTSVTTGKAVATAMKIRMGAYSTTPRSPGPTRRPRAWPRARRRPYGSTSARRVSTARPPRNAARSAPGGGGTRRPDRSGRVVGQDLLGVVHRQVHLRLGEL